MIISFPYRGHWIKLLRCSGIYEPKTYNVIIDDDLEFGELPFNQAIEAARSHIIQVETSLSSLLCQEDQLPIELGDDQIPF